MKIDIDALTESELVDLNNRVVARLRFLAEVRAHARMLEIRMGDRVAFQPHDQPEIVGTLTRYNRKSVTVITDRAAVECGTERAVPSRPRGELRRHSHPTA